MIGNGTCLDRECVCHVAARVLTPFPLDAGPSYCCNRCASERQYLRLLEARA